MSVYGQQVLLKLTHPKIRFRVLSADTMVLDYNVQDAKSPSWQPCGYIHGFYSTCSTVYVGQLDCVQRCMGTVEEILKILQRWAFNDPYVNYTEIMCTLRLTHTNLVEEVKREGFIPLGEPFTNLRTDHELQHFILRRVK